MTGDSLDIRLERGATRTFAIAPAWPGWARSARTKDGDEAAIEALLAYADRYSAIAARAGLALPARLAPAVSETLVGNATTDFGAPDLELGCDRPRRTARTDADLARQVALLLAVWDAFDDVVARAPEELRKGPRGGGRDTSAIVRHVVEAERAYARKVGVRHPPFEPADASARAALHDDLAAALLVDDRDAAWSARRALRRTAWHVLDHLWEIEDKSS